MKDKSRDAMKAWMKIADRIAVELKDIVVQRYRTIDPSQKDIALNRFLQIGPAAKNGK
jgi:hypothetical protein